MSTPCEELRLVWEEHILGELHGESARDLEAHLAGCERCREGYAGIEIVVRRLRAATAPSGVEGAWERFQERARERDREAAPAVRRVRLWRRPVVWAAAAALLLALGLVWGRGDGEIVQMTSKVSAKDPVNPPPGWTIVEVTLSVWSAPSSGSEFDLVRWGRTVGHGKVLMQVSGGRYAVEVWPEPGEQIDLGDRVRFVR